MGWCLSAARRPFSPGLKGKQKWVCHGIVDQVGIVNEIANREMGVPGDRDFASLAQEKEGATFAPSRSKELYGQTVSARNFRGIW
jgi:hypothetical protein